MTINLEDNEALRLNVVHKIGLPFNKDWQMQMIGENFTLSSLSVELKQNSNEICILIAYAALSGHTESLNWVKENYPRQLTAILFKENTVVNFAFLGRSLASLKWIKEHYPEWLADADPVKTKAVCLAIEAADLELLEWINANCQHLLTPKLDQGLSISLFNRAMSSKSFKKIMDEDIWIRLIKICLSITPQYLDIELANTFTLRVLSKFIDNLKPLKLYYPSSSQFNFALVKEIEKKCERNHKINEFYKQARAQIVPLIQGVYQLQKNPTLPSFLLFDIVSNIFLQLLPSIIGEHQSLTFFNKIKNSVDPDERLEHGFFKSKILHHRVAMKEKLEKNEPKKVKFEL